MADGQIVFEITADGKHAIASVKDVTRAIETESQKWDNAGKNAASGIENSFENMAKKVAATLSAAAIGKKLLEWGKAAIDAASDLREVQNVVDTVFGQGSKQIDEWAKKAVSQFGLSETMAKKFTSTLGAMMKSSGLAGDEIIKMSTDLSGLAADMSSFYNLDFDVAFEKIRAGIAGETAPLKALGINMSVANLNAFALSKGMSKTFEQMSQGEQTMLRYQYLMAATADAQGDFAKTADGYANSTRLIQQNLESLKTAIGTPLLSAMEKATAVANNLVTSLTPKEGEKTYLEKISEIEIDKEAKLKEIEEVASVARALAKDMGTIANSSSAGDAVKNLAEGANTLKSDSKTNWEAVLTSLTGIDGLENIFGDSKTAVQNISDLALALSGNSPDMTQAEAWEKLLGAMSSNMDAVSKLTGKDAKGAGEWLSELAKRASEIEPGDVAAWQDLMAVLLGGIDPNSTEGQQFISSMAQYYLAMGSGSEEAIAGLTALGLSTDEISQKQATWLSYCKELVKTIPGLSSIIDVNTGKINGGLPALSDYVDEWEKLAKYEAQVNAIEQERQVYNSMTDPNTLGAKRTVARSVAGAKLTNAGYTNYDQELDKLDQVIKKMVDAGYTWEDLKRNVFDVKTPLGIDVDAVSSATVAQTYSASAKVDPKDLIWINKLTGDAEEAVLSYAEATYTMMQTERERPLVLDSLTKSEEELAESMGITVDELREQQKAAEEAKQEMTLLERAMTGDAEAATEAAAAYTKAADALKAVGDYYDSVKQSTEQSVNSTVKGFEKVTKAADEARENKRKKDAELAAAEQKYAGVLKGEHSFEKIAAMDAAAFAKLPPKVQEAYNEIAKLKNEQDKLNDSVRQYEPETMLNNLNKQIDYMDEYTENLNKLKEWGVSDAMLAKLSDGSAESAEYLAGLVGDESEKAKKAALEVGEKFDEVEQRKQTFTKDLTDTKLVADKAYQELLDTAAGALDELNMYDEAYDSLYETCEGIADGIEESLPDVHAAVNQVLAELNRLGGYGINYGFDAGGGIEIAFGDAVGHFAGGTDWVPRNNYPAFLDYGEAVLTAQENQIWQRFKSGQQPGIDYSTLGGLMRDNVHAGGSVYLDGRTVGRVISDMQGNQYRTLQRSGWQS